MKNIIAIVSFILFAVCGPATATVIDIGSMTNPNVVLNFDAMSAGTTSIGAINSAFPGAGITSISFGGTGGSGTYSVNTGGGGGL